MNSMTDDDRFHVGGGRIWNKESIPTELKDQDKWVIAKMEEDGRKPPLYPYKSTVAGRGLSFGDVTKIMEDPDLGFIDTDRIGDNEKVIIGFMIDPDDDYYFIDWDDVRDPNVGNTSIPESVVKWVNEIGGYTEVSPSGTGLKTICKSDEIPESAIAFKKAGKTYFDMTPIADLKKKPHVQVYIGGQYTSITGNVLGCNDSDRASKGFTDGAPTLVDMEAKLQPSSTTASTNSGGNKRRKPDRLADIGRQSIHAKKYSYNKNDTTNQDCDEADWIKTDSPTVEQIVATGCRLDDSFRSLWNGNVSSYDTVSEADIALASKIWYYSDNRTLVNKVFQQSGLYGIRVRRSNLSDWRKQYPKWDVDSYRRSTIGKGSDNDRHRGRYLDPKD